MKNKNYTVNRVIRNLYVNPSVTEGFNNVIGFLNDVQAQFPGAISLVAGMPDENFFDLEHLVSDFQVYVHYLVEKADQMDRKNRYTRQQLTNSIGQYKSSKGMINDILAAYLKKDENISVDPGDILVTVGAQEAFAIIVSCMCDRKRDVILTEEPGYIGLSSFSKIAGYRVEGVRIQEDGIDLHSLENKIDALRDEGASVPLLYVIPDYQNPTGCCMPVWKRKELIGIAEKKNFLIIEDSVYNSFVYEGKRYPTLKSLDEYGRVLYVGSFSKLLFPGLRIGLIAAGQQLESASGKRIVLIDELEKVKGQITNNTSTVSQAILAGILIRQNYSLIAWSERKLNSYKQKHDAMLDALDKYIGQYTGEWAEGISWNRPGGGFFIRVSLPFDLTEKDLLDCAANFHVIYCPMSNFYIGKGGKNELRLTFSNHSVPTLEKGLACLAAFLMKKAADTRASVRADQITF